MNDLIRSTIACSEPLPLVLELHVALTTAWNEFNASGAIGDLPDTARRRLVSRQKHLADALTPAADERIRKILATISDMPGRVEEDRAKLRFALERDVHDLSEWPEWALAAACRAFRKGEAGDGVFRPTTGQIATWCRNRTDWLRQEQRKIAAVLAAKAAPRPPRTDPERRREIAEGVRRLTALTAAKKLTDEDIAAVFAGRR